MKLLFINLAAVLGLAFPACSQPQPGVLASRIVIDHIFIPWEIIYGPDDHIWLTQKNGYICRLEPNSGHLDSLYYEPQTVIQSEGGMLGMALHPDFLTQPYVFVAYEYLSGVDYRERVIRLTYAGDSLGQAQTIFDGISGAVNHNGCRLMIQGDKLFISTGDALNTSHAQDVNSLNGKILRLNLDGSIPADNPIPGSPLWSWGHRNPQGLVYHNGKLYSSEHGPGDNDEINIIQKGRNYGWPDVHGFCDAPQEIQFCADSNVAEPIFAWTPTIAPSGMDFYEGNMFPQWQNSLLLATLKDQHLYRLKLNSAGDSMLSADIIPGVDYGRLRDICVAPDGRIFISTSNSSADGSQQIDRIILLYDSATGIAPIVGDAEARVYPNPADDYIQTDLVKNILSGQIRYAIRDTNGKTILKGKTRTGRIAVKTLGPGLYFLSLAGKVIKFQKR
jgi:glucose/arabinose dehydrogenase